MREGRNGGKLKSGNTVNVGRKKKLPEIDVLLADVLGEEESGLSDAKNILEALKTKALKGDVRAAEILLERAYGKTKQNLNIEGALNIPQLKPVIISKNGDPQRSNMADSSGL
jgi:hypothetical protein